MKTGKSILKIAFLLISTFYLRPAPAQVSVHVDADTEVHLDQADLLISGDLYLDGDATTESSRIVFNGIDDQYIQQTTPKTLRHLKIDKTAGSLYLTDSLIIADSLSLTQGKIITSDDALLLMLSAAESNPGDSISFVDGPLAKVYTISVTPSSFTYPTGDAMDYRPVSVQLAAVADDSVTITVKQVNQNAQDLSTNYTGIDKVSSVRYWQIHDDGVGKFTGAQITLSYDTTYTNDGVEIGSELDIAQLDTSDTWVWNAVGGVGSDNYKGTIQSDPFSDFLSGYFTFGDAAGGMDISLPVLLSLFELSENRGEVLLNWKTESEIDNYYWLVQRKEHTVIDSINDEQQESSVTENFETIARLDGQGTKSAETVYAFQDNAISSGNKYSYRLVDVSINGRKHVHDAQSIIAGLPEKYKLFQNYPNPFNPVTNILYDLALNSDVRVDIFNILGQKVATLVNEKQKAGYYKIVWDSKNLNGNNLASGMYVLAIRAVGEQDGKTKNFYKVKKMMLVK